MTRVAWIRRSLGDIIGDNRAPASGFRPDASGAIGRRLNVESSNLNMMTKVHEPVTGAESMANPENCSL